VGIQWSLGLSAAVLLAVVGVLALRLQRGAGAVDVEPAAEAAS
jgi:hypothetical protein